MRPYTFNCPNCSVKLMFENGAESVRCDFCKQEIFRPKDKEDVRELLNEADKLCQELRFDEALYLYNKAYRMDPQSAGAIWGKLRCKHGVEIVYEEETRQPYNVCHRRNAPWVDDAYYDILKNDRTYRESVNAIRSDVLQFNKLRSQRERYDIFLCYKHTERASDAYGQVTTCPSQDCEWVRALYDRLSAAIGGKYRIFYAPVSLKELTGGYYAAGISYALSTARVMLVIGSKGEYFNGTWVKSEWSRFRAMQSEGCSRTLIPVCRGLYENDLPTDLQHLQNIMCSAADDGAGMDRVVAGIQAAVEKQFAEHDYGDLHRWHLTVSEFDQLRDSFRRLDRNMQAMENQNSALQKKLDDEVGRSSEKEDRIKQLSMEYGNLKSDNDYIHSLYAKQSGKVYMLEEEAKGLQSDLKSRDSEIRKLTDRLRDRDASLQDMQRRLDKAERQAAESEKYKNRAESLQQSLDALRAEAQKLEHAFHGQRELAQSRAEELEAQKSHMEQLQFLLDSKEAVAENMEKQHWLREKEHTAALAEMTRKLEAANQARKAAEQKARQSAAAQADADALEQSLKDRDAEIVKLKNEIGSKERLFAPSLAEMTRKLEEANRARELAEQKARELGQQAQSEAKPVESAYQPALRIGEYGFAYRDSSDTWRKCDADLSKVPADFRKDKLDHIYFTIENKSKKVQNIAIRIDDPFGRQSHVFEAQKIKPNYSAEYRLPVKGDIRTMSHILTVIAIDGAGKHTPVGPMAFKPK